MTTRRVKVIKKQVIEEDKTFCERYCECQFYSISYDSIPKLNCCLAIIIFFLNICFPGIGTMLLEFSKGKNHFLVGLTQLVFSIILVGWIMSILWGLEVLRKSNEGETPDGGELRDSNNMEI